MEQTMAACPPSYESSIFMVLPDTIAMLHLNPFAVAPDSRPDTHTWLSKPLGSTMNHLGPYSYNDPGPAMPCGPCLPGRYQPTRVVAIQDERGPPNSAEVVSKDDMTPAPDADRPYHCSDCSRKCKRLKHLKRHSLQHTGRQRPMCKLCLKNFTRKDTLKTHFKRCTANGKPTDVGRPPYSSARRKKNTVLGQLNRRSKLAANNALLDTANFGNSFSHGMPTGQSVIPVLDGSNDHHEARDDLYARILADALGLELNNRAYPDV